MNMPLWLPRHRFYPFFAILLGPSIVASQVPAGRTLEFNVDGGPTLHQATEPRGDLGGCLTSRPTVSYSGAIRYHLGAGWALEAALTSWPGYKYDGPCVLPPSPRAVGPDTTHGYSVDSHGLSYPIHLTTIGVGRALWQSRQLGLWIDAGMGRSWTHHLWVPQAALRVTWRHGLVRPTISGGLLHYAYDRLEGAYLYQDQRFVRSEQTRLRVHETQWLVRAGVAVPIRR